MIAMGFTAPKIFTLQSKISNLNTLPLDKDALINADMKTEPQNSAKTDLNQTPSSSATWKQSLWENVQIVAIALVMAFLIRMWIAEPRFIPSESMLPTLEQGDRLVVEKLSYRFHDPQKGDIVVFHPPSILQSQGYDSDNAFIKRVIGTSGDIIEVKNGIVYVNDQPLEESYILETPHYNLYAVQVPKGQLFVMGDNRNNSNDSHVWGFLPQRNLIGHAVFRFWPLSRLGSL